MLLAAQAELPSGFPSTFLFAAVELVFPRLALHLRPGINTGKHFNYLWIRPSDCIVVEALKIAVIKTISRLACAILSWTEKGLMGH